MAFAVVWPTSLLRPPVWYRGSVSGDAPEKLLIQPKPKTAKFLDGLLDPDSLPPWVTQADLDYYVAQYEMSGFRGPLNWYRNIDRNAGLTAQLASAKIEQPSLFIAGTKALLGFLKLL